MSWQLAVAVGRNDRKLKINYTKNYYNEKDDNRTSSAFLGN
jgi:hypothetical protein